MLHVYAVFTDSLRYRVEVRGYEADSLGQRAASQPHRSQRWKSHRPGNGGALAIRGAELIALTDHNSVSGHPQLLPACREKGVHGLRGIEVTTFYGHVLGLGVKEYIDWRGYSPECLKKSVGISENWRTGRIGAPYTDRLSRCYRMCLALPYFRLRRLRLYRNFDTSDFQFCRNDLAIELWINRLRAGNTHLAAVSGLDYHARPWHGKETVTWLGVDSGIADPESAALDAIRSQRLLSAKIA